MVNNPFSLLLVLLFVTGFATNLFAEVTVSIDRDPVALDESFQITYSSDDKVDGAPDFGPLKKDFEILRQNRSSNVTMINGNIIRSQIWVVEVMPKRTGILTIPALRFGARQSQATTIIVKDAAELPDQQTEKDVFIEVEAAPEDPYVQAQTGYTVRLFRSVDIHNAMLTDPEVEEDEALVQRIGDDRRYETFRDGRRYEVIERRYAISPRKSGRVTIQPVRFEGRIGSGSRLFFDPFQRSQSIRRRSQPVTLDVRPMPSSYPQDLWLPAQKLELQEVWSEDPPAFKVGEPITRTIALLATGLMAEQLPEIDQTLPKGFKQYPDQPVLENRPNGPGIVGVRQDKIAIIPGRAGDYVLPAVDIPWWNTKEKRIEHTRLPERNVTVLPAAGNGQQTNQNPIAEAQETEDETGKIPTTPSEHAPRSAISDIWRWSTLVFALGWAITALAWWRSGRRRSEREETPARPGTKESVKTLKRACKKGDALGAKQALLEWSRAQWPHTPTSLGDIATRCPDPLRIELEKLNEFLYSPRQEPWQDGDRLWNAFKQVPTIQKNTPETKSFDLEPLYKT